MNVKSILIGFVLGAATTWSIVSFAARDNTLGLAPGLSLATSADGQTVYLAYNLGYFKSVDGGETWQKLKGRITEGSVAQ